MYTTVLIITGVICLVVTGVILGQGISRPLASTHPEQTDALDYEQINNAYLVQATPYFGPPPPAATLEPIKNRVHISDD